VLGVARDASQEEIKRAFRRKALELHPDRNPDDPSAEEKFKEISRAYQVLSDPEQRARYDRFGEAGVQSSAGGATGPDFGFEGFGDFSDLFEAFFGGPSRRGPRAGASLEYELELTLEESYYGTTKQLHFNRLGRCKYCAGTGSASQSAPTTCPLCGGAGRVRQTQHTFFGQFSTLVTCPRCQGTGRSLKDPCPHCEGTGLMNEEVTLKLEIPEGTLEGQKLRLKGEGDAGEQGQPSGDLLVRIRLKPHEVFERRGLDLHLELPISVFDALLGTTQEVPTLEGKTKLKLNPGTQPGEVVRLKGKGLYNGVRNRRGDLFVTVKVLVPRRLDRHHRELLERLRNEVNIEKEPERASFLEKLKRFVSGR